MIIIDEGGEYEGERYIRCDLDEHGNLHEFFKGRTLKELESFIEEHRYHGVSGES